MKSYLKSKQFYPEEARFLFKLRSRMVNLKANSSSIHDNLDCRLCNKEIEDQEHFLSCELLNNEDILPDSVKYSDIFSDKNGKVKIITGIIQNKLNKRERILEEQDT